VDGAEHLVLPADRHQDSRGWQQAVQPFRKTDRLSESERSMLMGGACAKAYRWSPKKS